MNTKFFSRNLFEVDNARYLSTGEVVRTFVPTKSFWRLLSSKNHIVLGARGSGKTAILKMLAHNHLSQFENPDAKTVISSKSFIGIYLPAKADWVGGLRNKSWLTEDEKEVLFCWRLNLASCLAMTTTLESCLKTYINDDVARIRTETKLCSALFRSWFNESRETATLQELSEALEELDFKKQLDIARHRVSGELIASEVGLAFHTELFQPVKLAIRYGSELLDISDAATWMLCLDEAEALEPFHHRIINSFLRTHSGNLVFKVSTTPYGHYTLDTNVGAGLSVGNDFEYVYIDNDMRDVDLTRSGRSTIEAKIFEKRAQQSGDDFKRLTLLKLLGDSELLKPKAVSVEATEELLAYVRANGENALIERAKTLSRIPVKFRNEIGRKIQGAVLLRKSVEALRGQQEIDLYSGAAMLVRCSDGNPRRLIRLFNRMLLEGDWKTTPKGRKAFQPISKKRQTEIIRNFSVSVLARVQGEPDFGPNLHSLLEQIGDYMRRALHSAPLTTDTISSITLGPTTSSDLWGLVRAGVGLGLFYPNVHPKAPDEMPEKEGAFHLAYVLAPAFYLLPRRGKARRLETMLLRSMDRGQSGQIGFEFGDFS